MALLQITRTDDLSVLRRYASSGDPRAFEVLVERYQSMVLATCRRTLGDHADAEDATQETFLKLANHAGRITSNAAAWLHACALRTSLDQLRRRGARDRAERAAGAQKAQVDEDERAWTEIEPVLDEALARLDEADRSLIVERFLAGRAQTEMAKEAGISPGGMHRRIDRALDRLRKELKSAGLGAAVISGSGATWLGMVIAGGSRVAASPELSASLAKTGLAGMASVKTGGGGLATKIVSAAVVGVVGIASVTTISMMQPGGTRSTTPVVAAASGGWSPEGEAVQRPKKATKKLPLLLGMEGGEPFGRMMCEGGRVTMELTPDEGDGPGGVVFRIVSADSRADPPEMAIRIESSTMPQGNDPFGPLVGMTIDATYEFNGSRLTMQAEPPDEFADESDELVWHGVRPPAWHPEAAESARLSTGSGPAPELEGLWFQIHWALDLQLKKEDIVVTWNEYTVHRFRILDWEERDGYTRVQSICADSMDPRLVGNRVKLLLRKDDSGFSYAHHTSDSGRLNEWPVGFDGRDDADLTVMTFGEDGRP